jgi:putative ABC transport system permease protein
MSWWDTLRSGLEAVATHRLRSGLTVLGILIGIAAVILTVGFGEGATASIDSAINSLGSNLLIVTPGSTTTGLVRGGFGTASTLTYANAQALSDKVDCPDIVGVAPQVDRSETVDAGTETWTTDVYGSTAAYLSVRDRSIALGSFFTPQEVADDDNVAVLGETTAQELGLFSPVGQTIDIADVPFTVIGVFASEGSSGSTNDDDLVVVPITTAQEVLIGSSTVSTIYLEAASSSAMGAADEEATDELLSLHNINDPADADFTITSQSSILSTETSANNTLTILLGGIAAISLIVGGIGVMNIMLVSVTERIREIGLRKALGATPAVIRRQFLVEASALGLAGGLLGAALGVTGAVVLPDFISNKITISPPATVGAIVVAMAIGVIFGVYPASRAARLAPIEALRSD